MRIWNNKYQTAAFVLGILAILSFVVFGVFPDVLFPYTGPSGIDSIGQALGRVIIIRAIATFLPIVLVIISIVLAVISRKNYGKSKKNIIALVPTLLIAACLVALQASTQISDGIFADEHSVDIATVQGGQLQISDKKFKYEVVFDSNNNQIRVGNTAITLNNSVFEIDTKQSSHIEFDDNIVNTLANDYAVVKYRGQEAGPIVCVFDNDAQYDYYAENSGGFRSRGYSEEFIQHSCLVDHKYDYTGKGEESDGGNIVYYKNNNSKVSPRYDLLYIKLPEGGCVLLFGKVSPYYVSLGRSQ
jgi:hypothetical protein